MKADPRRVTLRARGQAAIRLATDALAGWRKDDAPRLGAALAYYTLFSLAPLLVVIIAIAGLLFGRDAAQGRIVEEFQQLIGISGATAIEEMIQSARRTEVSGMAAIIGTLTLLIGATGVGVEMKNALNIIWRARPPRRRWVWGWVRARLAALALVVIVGFLLLVSLIVNALLSATDGALQFFFPDPAISPQVVNAVISFVVITVLFAMVFKILPDTKIEWRDVWAGALVTSFLFSGGKAILGIYLGKSSFASVYGAAGSLVVIVVWVYYVAQILFYGAEVTQVYAHRYGSRLGYADR